MQLLYVLAYMAITGRQFGPGTICEFISSTTLTSFQFQTLTLVVWSMFDCVWEALFGVWYWNNIPLCGVISVWQVPWLCCAKSTENSRGITICCTILTAKNLCWCVYASLASLTVSVHIHISLFIIIAVLGRALAVVKVTSQVNGKTQFSGSCPQKTIRPMAIKFGTIDYVGEGNPHTKFGGQANNGGFSPSQQCSVEH